MNDRKSSARVVESCCLRAICVCRPLFAGLAMVALSGCVELEFDRMTGTAFPPELSIAGETVDVESIYFDAGRLVILNEDESGIAPLNIVDDECISDAELDALEVGHRNVPLFPVGNRSFLYGVAVDHHGEVDGACVPNFVLGKMWAGHTRSAFAIFFPNSTIEAGSEEYLRTTVHEIGHALNLHHEDGDGSTTIMNQSSNLDSDWTFTFSAASLEHLQEHPPGCVFPGTVGGAPFYWVIGDHADAHDRTTEFDCS